MSSLSSTTIDTLTAAIESVASRVLTTANTTISDNETFAASTNPFLCDWTITASDCRDADFIRYMLISSSIAHFITGIYGIWLLAYRNRGFNSGIVANLFVPVGTGIRPKPMDCIIFFFTIASFLKIPANLPLILNTLQHAFWLRIALGQLYWVTVTIAFFTYFVGLLYAMPVTTRDGIFAVYQPETPYGSKPLSPIHVLTPTTVQKNVILFAGPTYTFLIGVGLGIAAGIVYDQGNMHLYKILMRCQYGNLALVFFLEAVMFFYYGLKYTFILRANIIIAEAALKAPRAAFGIGNIVSRSPARFLFIQLKILGFGGCAVTTLAGSLILIWVLRRDHIMEMTNDKLAHTMAVFWTCTMALGFFSVMVLTTIQSVRTRRRNTSEPSVAATHADMPTQNPTSPSGGNIDGTGASLQKYSNHPQSHSYNSKVSKQVASRSDPEVCLTHGSSGDVSTMHSLTFEKNSLELNDDAAMQDLERGLGDDRDPQYKATSLTPPPRPSVITSFTPRTEPSFDENRSHLRESVFGGRTPREGATSPPQSPTSGGFGLAAFPKRSSRSSGPRTSTSPSRHSRGSSRNVPNSPSLYLMSQDPPSSPPPQYSPTKKSMSQPVPRLGGPVRKQSIGGTERVASPTFQSSPLPLSASRGGGGGYRAQGIELESVQTSYRQQQ